MQHLLLVHGRKSILIFTLYIKKTGHIYVRWRKAHLYSNLFSVSVVCITLTITVVWHCPFDRLFVQERSTIWRTQKISKTKTSTANRSGRWASVMMNFKSSCFELKEKFLLCSQSFANRKTQFKWYVQNLYYAEWPWHVWMEQMSHYFVQVLPVVSFWCKHIIFRHKMHDHWVMVIMNSVCYDVFYSSELRRKLLAKFIWGNFI